MSYSVHKNINLSSDLSIRIGDFRGIKSGILYGYNVDLAGDERGISHGLVSSEQISFVTTSTSFAIASTDNADTHTITIEYYADTTSETPVTQNVVLTGNTEVTISTNMFRIMKLKNASSTNPAGTIYIGLDSDTYTAGKPDGSIYGLMVGEAGLSHMSIIYCPPNKNVYFVSARYQSDMDKDSDVHLVKYKSHTNANPNALFIRYFPFSSGLSSTEKIYSDPLTALMTAQITAQRVDGAGIHDVVIQISYVIVDDPLD